MKRIKVVDLKLKEESGMFWSPRCCLLSLFHIISISISVHTFWSFVINRLAIFSKTSSSILSESFFGVIWTHIPGLHERGDRFLIISSLASKSWIDDVSSIFWESLFGWLLGWPSVWIWRRVKEVRIEKLEKWDKKILLTDQRRRSRRRRTELEKREREDARQIKVSLYTTKTKGFSVRFLPLKQLHC